MEKVRRDTNFIVLGLVLYTLLRYVIFALEPLARVCFVRLVCSDSAERTVLLQQLEENAANSGVSSIVAVLAGVLFLGWYFRRDTPPRMVFQKKQPLPWKRLPLLICIFMGAQLIYSLFGNVLEFLLRLCGYTAMGQLNAASAQSTTVSMFLYTLFSPLWEKNSLPRAGHAAVSEVRERCLHCGSCSVVRRDACQLVSDDICISHRTGAGIHGGRVLSPLVDCAASGQ